MTSLATTAADVPGVFAARFNTGDLDKITEVYETGAVLADETGNAIGGSDLHAMLRGHLSLGIPITVSPRKVFETGDIALLIVDWAIGDGIRGTATDVARRGPDGYWRYVIDNPFGTA